MYILYINNQRLLQPVSIMNRSLLENQKRNNTIHRLIVQSKGHGDNDNNMCLVSTKYQLDVTIIILA